MGHRCAPKGRSREGRGKGTDLRASEDMARGLSRRPPSRCSKGCGGGRAHAMDWIELLQRSLRGHAEVGWEWGAGSEEQALNRV